ncbi:transcriptional regulator FtsR [Leifsonia sp. Leaf264]|uniref:transcriptional regulator FtsR n=1 Tax=Leifsonia sp. Leaf264 TaxID=1736314 RepID=UPI0006FDCCB0|nr:MerR family transcriptional regulator [Leifsonia sp. Leaf264]KQO99735.1 MerR family transcriptional regulator [Leifsonia sp. Leaf264]
MAGAGAHARVPATPSLLSIGQVLARLTPEHPELTPSKLRFLEEQGLISPARTESGYRKFCAADVERIQLILGMQRDHYLPLKVIRGYLEQLDAGHVPTLPGTAATGPSMLSTARRFDRDELLRESDASPQLLADAVSASLIVPADVYSEETVSVLRALAELRKAGIEPRHLRGFRAAAERESSLIETAMTPIVRRNDASSRAKGAELALEIASQLEVVRSTLLRAALQRVTNP